MKNCISYLGAIYLTRVPMYDFKKNHCFKFNIFLCIVLNLLKQHGGIINTMEMLVMWFQNDFRFRFYRAHVSGCMGRVGRTVNVVEIVWILRIVKEWNLSFVSPFKKHIQTGHRQMLIGLPKKCESYEYWGFKLIILPNKL